MVTGGTREQARILFQFGKRMRDQVLKMHMSLPQKPRGRIPDDLSPPQIHMLLKIREQQECTISELATLLEVSSPSVSTMVDRLVDKGALLRERSTADRRVVVVRLAAGAKAQMDELERAMLDNFLTMIDKIGPELTEQWCAVIEQINEVFQKEMN